jgi:hypothetical protein
MSARRPSAFKQRDLTRAVKAVTAAGVDVGRVEIDKEGTIRIIAAGSEPAGECREANEWDRI